MNDHDRKLLLDFIEYIRYWENGFFNNDVNKTKWNGWYINPNEGYVIFDSYQSKKEIMPEAVKLCDTTLETFKTLTNESLFECVKYMNKQLDSKEPL